MKTETTKRILAALITIPIAISLTGCGGQDSKKSEPVKPAVTSSQSVKEDKAAKEKAQVEAKAKAEAAAKAQAQATPAPQKPAVKQVQKPAVQQTRKPAPARQYRAPKKPAPRTKTHSGNNGGGYKLKPYEKSFDKNDLDTDGNITGGGDEFGNTW